MHVPTSVVLEKLLNDAAPDRVTLLWLTSGLRKRSFGLLMLLMALVALIPGASILMAVLLGFLAVQMILARERPGLPRFIASRSIPTPQLARLVHRIVPLLRRMEKLIHPRWTTPFEATKRAVGFVVLLLAATILSPFPFSHIIPALVILLLSFAYLEEDGVLLCISLGAAFISLTITAATIWGAIRTADLLDTVLS
jgi:hypothetical protein